MTTERAILVAELSAPGADVVHVPTELFPCLLWDHLGSWNLEQRQRIARSLIDRGCRYAVCAGFEPDEWHLAFDLAFVDKYQHCSDVERDENHVMTTSHANDPMDEVAFYFVSNTHFDHHEFREFLVVHIGDSVDKLRLNETVEALVLKRGQSALTRRCS